MNDKLYIPADGTICIEINGYNSKQHQNGLDANWLGALVTYAKSLVVLASKQPVLLLDGKRKKIVSNMHIVE